MTPFRQLRFDDLPDRPRVAHRWSEVEPHRELLRTTSFGDHHASWYTFGAGPPLLLVHGLMTAAYSWRYLLPLLGARWRLVMPDLPGSGASDKPARSYHPDRLAEWIGEFADHLGIRGCATVGNSLGGYLCLRLALRDPAALGPLVDLHSPGVPLARLWALKAALALPAADGLLRWLVHRDPERWVHRNVHYYDETLKSREEARVWAEPLRTREGVDAFYRTLRETTDPGAMRAFVGELAARRDRGEAFPVPLLLVYATTDPLVPPWVGDRLAELIPSASLRKLDRASHFAHVDAADRLAPLLTEFFTAHPAQRTAEHE